MGQVVHDREFGLGWALAAALALHAIMLLVSMVLPVFEFVRAAPPAEERITFSLAEPVTIDEDVTDSAPPEPSLPTPEAEQARPAFEPPSPPIEVVARDEAATEPLDAAEPPPPRADPLAVPLPETRPEAETVDLGAGDASTTERTQPQRGSLAGALREFRSAVRSAPRPPPVAESAAPRAPSNVFVPDMSQVPVSGSQLGELTFESRDYDWSEYGRQIYMAIWRAWHRRLHASTDEFERWAHGTGNWYLDHQSGVRFVIERSGRVVGIRVEQPGGCEPLDRSAADALAEVLLPPLPADFPRDQEVVHARFVIRGEVRAMRPVLRRMKATGVF